MTTSEFSYGFDVLYNNVTSNQAPGLNGYEKSVFLTKAEKQLVQEYYNQRTDVQGGGVDGSPKRQIDFSKIIVTETRSPVMPTDAYTYIDKRAVVFDSLTYSAIAVLNESFDIVVTSTLQNDQESNTIIKTYTVKSLSFDEYARLMSKPYKYPQKGQVWKLVSNQGLVEVIGKDLDARSVSQTYNLRTRYVRVPTPIVVESLAGLGVTIDGVTTVTDCELPEEMHHEILERAVALAKIAWQGATMTQVAAAQK